MSEAVAAPARRSPSFAGGAGRVGGRARGRRRRASTRGASSGSPPAPAYLHESWHPSGGTGDAVHTGWGPALDVTVGKFVRPRLMVARQPGRSPRSSTATRRRWGRPTRSTTRFTSSTRPPRSWTSTRTRRAGLHAGGALGIAAITEVDTHMGGSQTSWGPVVALHVGWERFVSRRWSAGGMLRLAFYHYGTDTPPPDASANGLLDQPAADVHVRLTAIRGAGRAESGRTATDRSVDAPARPADRGTRSHCRSIRPAARRAAAPDVAADRAPAGPAIRRCPCRRHRKRRPRARRRCSSDERTSVRACISTRTQISSPVASAVSADTPGVAAISSVVAGFAL